MNKKPTLGQELWRHALLIVASIAMVYPLLWMIASSFKPDSEIFSNPTALPTSLDLTNYIEGFKAFTQAFIVSGGTGGPIDSTLFYSLYLYEEAFANFRMGYASALAWLLLIIIAIFTAIAFGTSKYWVYYEDESR